MSSQVPLVVAVSRPGRLLAERIARTLQGECASRDVLGEAFQAGRPVIAVGALGIWTRLIAPYLTDKATDPPLVVVDDAGRFAIAVVGGHHGGNLLAERVALAVGATPVITTATDVLGLPAVEVIAEAHGWRLAATREARLHVAAALVDGGHPVLVYQDCGARSWQQTLPAHVILSAVPPAAHVRGAAAAIFVTDRLLPEIDGWGEHAIVLRPRTLVAGVGASRGVSPDEVLALLRAALAEAGLAEASLHSMATADIKRDERGLAAAAEICDVPVRYFTAAELAVVSVPTPSAVVARHVQTPSVCEAAALLAAGAHELVVGKRKSAHATVAIARAGEAEP